jgi:hypothetical protein
MIKAVMSLIQWLFGKKEGKKEVNFANADISLTVGEKASSARQMLDNPIFQTAFQEIRSEIILMWENAAVDDEAKRKFCWEYLKALNQVKGRLEKYINDAVYQRHLDDRKSQGPENRTPQGAI